MIIKMKAQLTIILLLIVVGTTVLYFTLCTKTDPYEIQKDVETPEHVPVEPPVKNLEPVIVVPEYFPLGYGPQRYEAHNDYLPDSLYTRPCNCPNCVEFEGLNFDPYAERMTEVNDLIYRENRDDLRNF